MSTALFLSLLLPAATPAELGDVNWLRDIEEAKQQSKASGRPVLVLFDEVPGCGTCVRYGQAVLSHPLIVEAAETLFVPVAIYNNVGGKDREVLNRFKEPTWNNPVVRVVDANERPLSPRLSGDYSRGGLLRTMIVSLKKAKRPVPTWLSELAQEFGARQTEKAVVAMYCFWSGEGCLGQMQGVLSSRTGFAEGREVVEITYDPEVTSYTQLLSAGKTNKCFSEVLASSDQQARQAKQLGLQTKRFDGRVRASSKDDKYRLAHTAWRAVAMTPRQASRVNAALSNGANGAEFLSPRQRALGQAAAKNGKSASRPPINGSLELEALKMAAGPKS